MEGLHLTPMIKSPVAMFGMGDIASRPLPILPSDCQIKAVQTLSFKLCHPNAKLPTRGSEGAAGLDLYAATEQPFGHNMLEYDTGVAVAIPPGYVGLVFPRSSITGTCLRLANCVGVIDSDYRGTIRFRFDFASHNQDSDRSYNVGERIGQLVIIPCCMWSPVEVQELPNTERGQGGFGSTGA